MTLARRKDHTKKDHEDGLVGEKDIKGFLVLYDIPHKWHNEKKESKKDVDFNIIVRGIFAQLWPEEEGKAAQLCSERMGIKRTDEHYGNSRVRFRTSAIKEQAHKPNTIFYIQPSWYGDYAYCQKMSILYEYYKLAKASWKNAQWEYGIEIRELLIKGKLEEFIEIPLKWDDKELVKEIKLC